MAITLRIGTLSDEDLYELSTKNGFIKLSSGVPTPNASGFIGATVKVISTLDQQGVNLRLLQDEKFLSRVAGLAVQYGRELEKSTEM